MRLDLAISKEVDSLQIFVRTKNFVPIRKHLV